MQMCHQCDAQSLQVIPEEEASNCNLDDNSAGAHSYTAGCMSDSDENVISSSTDVQLESRVDSNPRETYLNSFDNLLDYSASVSAKSDIETIEEIERNKNTKMPMCQSCDIGFHLSDDLLSCIGE